LRCARENLELFARMLLTLGCSIVVRQPRGFDEAFDRLAARPGSSAAAGSGKLGMATTV
jgi:hypothetical protein